MPECPKCKSTKIIKSTFHLFHDSYECLECGNWWYNRIEECCRNPWQIVTQCHKFSSNTRLYIQCTNCGGCLNRNKPLSFKKYSEDIEGPFMDNYFDEWKLKVRDEHDQLFVSKTNLNFINSHYYKYHVYLSSEEWRNKRQKVLERDKLLCQNCKTAEASDVHHKHYNNVFNEDLEDLTSLCRACHEKEHNCH